MEIGRRVLLMISPERRKKFIYRRDNIRDIIRDSVLSRCVEGVGPAISGYKEAHCVFESEKTLT
jgi:hypothetical protein